MLFKYITNIRIRLRIGGYLVTGIRICIRIRRVSRAGIRIRIRIRGYANFDIQSISSVYVPTSQLDLPSLTLLSVAGCGRLQLGVPHWATSVALLQVVDN